MCVPADCVPGLRDFGWRTQDQESQQNDESHSWGSCQAQNHSLWNTHSEQSQGWSTICFVILFCLFLHSEVLHSEGYNCVLQHQITKWVCLQTFEFPKLSWACWWHHTYWWPVLCDKLALLAWWWWCFFLKPARNLPGPAKVWDLTRHW